MTQAVRDVYSCLTPNGSFYLETTGINSEFYQEKLELVKYFNRRTAANCKEELPGYITAEEFVKHWPGKPSLKPIPNLN